MPKSEDRAISGFVDFFEVGITDRPPSNGPSDEIDNPGTNPADQPRFEGIGSAEAQSSPSSFAISSRVLRIRKPVSC